MEREAWFIPDYLCSSSYHRRASAHNLTLIGTRSSDPTNVFPRPIPPFYVTTSFLSSHCPTFLLSAFFFFFHDVEFLLAYIETYTMREIVGRNGRSIERTRSMGASINRSRVRRRWFSWSRRWFKIDQRFRFRPDRLFCKSVVISSRRCRSGQTAERYRSWLIFWSS